MSLPKKGLGRGLSALIPGASEPRIETDSEALSFRVEVDRITPSPFDLGGHLMKPESKSSLRRYETKASFSRW